MKFKFNFTIFFLVCICYKKKTPLGAVRAEGLPKGGNFMR